MYNSAENRSTLFGQQNGRCTGCLRPFPSRNFTVDHILPQSKGGGHDLDNLQLLCGACNSKKGAGTQEELIAKLAAEGVIRAAGLFARRKGRYAPTGEGTMSPVAAAVAVPLVTLALPYVAAGVEKSMKIAYEHRAEIKQEAEKQARRVKGGAEKSMKIAYERRAEIKQKAEKQARRVKGVKVPAPDVPMPRLPRFRTRYAKWNAEQEERMAVHHWWWWTASGSDEARATA